MPPLIARLIEQEYEALADEMLSAATPSSALAQLLSSSTPSSALAGSAYAGGANGGSASQLQPPMTRTLLLLLQRATA